MKKLLFSFNIKLFLWFWLITLISVVATKVILGYLQNDLVEVPITEKDTRKMAHFVDRFNYSSVKNIYRHNRRLDKKHRHILMVRNTESGRITTGIKARLPRLKRFFAEQDFSQLVNYQTPDFRILGPTDITLDGEPFQLFIVDKSPPQNFGFLLMRLPHWVRIIFPVTISFVLCWVLARSLSRPVREMREAVAKLGDGDLTARVDNVAKRSDELGSLGESFNQMAEKLQLGLSAQQRLIADVSHELRTPMTRLQIALGLAQKSATSPQELEKYLARCEKEVTRLDQMVADVLSLSRLENALHQMQFEPVNFASLLDNLVADARFIAEQKSVEIIYLPLNKCVIEADAQLIVGAISNVLMNAVKYSPESSSVTLSTQLSDNSIKVSISDQGRGVPEHALASLFDAFYRVNDARDRETGGTGLGLAIAKQSVLAHQGMISAENNVDAGLSVHIELPTKQSL